MKSMPTAEVGFFAIVMTIQAKSGGNLSEALSTSPSCLRDRKRLEGKIKAMSSEAKASAGIIGSLPPAVMGIVYLTTPAYINLLFTERAGNLMLAWLRHLDERRHHGDAQDDQLQALGGAHGQYWHPQSPVRQDVSWPRRGRDLWPSPPS